MTLDIRNADSNENLITHRNDEIVDIQISQYEKKLKNKDNLALPFDQELEMLKELTEFALGKFLLLNKGLNGYWTSYVTLHGPQKDSLSSLETWLLHSAPTVKATRERFYIFQQVLQEYLKNGVTIASIPCGVMDDLVSLDTGLFQDITFVGIDYDRESINLAKINGKSVKNINFEFYQKDAWNLEKTTQFEIITSNGLNIYEPNDNTVIELYKNFYRALKPNGILITSFLTPPPNLSEESTWKNYNASDILKQKALFTDIIGGNWQSFRTETQTKHQLEEAGFQEIKFIYDSQCMFPTVIANK